MRYLLLGILGGIFFVTASPAVAPAASYPELQKAATSDVSYNWAGYEADGGTYTGVSGSWAVPQVSDGAGFSADATWVGIGGTVSDDLLQAGTQAVVDPSSGKVVYQAWVEAMPEASRPLPVDVAPGDQVSVALQEVAPSKWRLTFDNHTNGQHYSTMLSYASSYSSAEWIEEMPSSLRGSFIPLDNFGTVHFTGAAAVKDGVSQNLSDLDASVLDMVNRQGDPLAETSVVGAGSAFSISRTNAAAEVAAAHKRFRFR